MIHNIKAHLITYCIAFNLYWCDSVYKCFLMLVPGNSYLSISQVGEFCPRIERILSGGILSEGDYVRGDFVRLPICDIVFHAGISHLYASNKNLCYQNLT